MPKLRIPAMTWSADQTTPSHSRSVIFPLRVIKAHKSKTWRQLMTRNVKPRLKTKPYSNDKYLLH